jgi:predicted RNase H-like HicB family nuclease
MLGRSARHYIGAELREETAMNLFKSKKQHQDLDAPIPILVRFWQEDGVWNASAMDISVAVFGYTFEEARRNFEEALARHFEVLCEMNQIDRTIKILSKAAKDRGFYDRIQPRETYEKFLVPPTGPHFAHV